MRLTDHLCPSASTHCRSEELMLANQASVRHCEQCDQDGTLNHARAGLCIARVIPDESELPVMYLGQPKDERGIDDALEKLPAPRACPRCHYPAPSWRT